MLSAPIRYPAQQPHRAWPNDHGVGNAGDHGGAVNLVCDEFGAAWLGGDLWLEGCAAGATGLLRRDF